MSEPTPQAREPRVFGLLSIIFAAFGLLWSLVDTIGLHGTRLAKDWSFDGATCIAMLYLGLSVWLVAIGVGQLGYRRWAWVHGRRWSLIGLALIVAEIVFNLAGGRDRAFDMGHAFPMGGAMWIARVVFFAPYPVCVLLITRRPAVVAAMDR